MMVTFSRDWKIGLLTASIAHLCLAIICVLIVIIHQHAFTYRVFTHMWNSWDGNSYVFLSQHGYVTQGDTAHYIVFYPLYPFLLSILEKVMFEPHVAGLLLTLSGSIIGQAAFFVSLREREYSVTRALRVLLLLSCNPIALYFLLVCTEGIFLACIGVFFLFLHRRQFARAALIGFLASSTRFLGLALLAPFVIQFFVDRPQGSIEWKKMIWGICIPLGFAVYLAINQFYFHNPFYYQTVLQHNWFKYPVNPLLQYVTQAKSLISGSPFNLPTYYLDRLTTILFPVLLLLYLVIKRTKIWWTGIAFALANFLVICAQSYWLSNTRYLFLILPLYVFIEECAQRSRIVFIAIVGIFFATSLLAMDIFARGGWVY